MKENDIGKLYKQKFENFEVPVGTEEWAFIKSGVAKSAAGKTGFFSFTAQHFNIYYLAAANVIVGSAVSVAVYQYNQSNDTPTENNTGKNEILAPLPTEEKKDSTVNLYEEPTKAKEEYTNTSAASEKNATSKDNSTTSNADTSSTVNKFVPTSPESKPVLKDTVATLPKSAPKKMVYINKRDTIVVTDTVDTPPDKKRKKK